MGRLLEGTQIVVELSQDRYDLGKIIPEKRGKMDIQSSSHPGRAEPPLILSIDIGTSSVKTAIFDLLGRSIAGSVARRPVEVITLPDGTLVVDADRLLNSVWDCIDATMAHSMASHQQIAGVGCCTFVSNVLGVES